MSNFPNEIKKILVTGGAGFIGGALIRKLLIETNLLVYNLDKIGYASDLTSINQIIDRQSLIKKRYQFIHIDLKDKQEIKKAIISIKPDIIFHLAAESHVDKSIYEPEKFIDNNIIGTFNLLEAVRSYWKEISKEKQQFFKFHHISTDEVYGALGLTGFFSEKTPYSPSNPYSSSKAASDHLVKAWNTTYGIPTLISNCSNNYGPWQFPEKLIPQTIINAIQSKKIPLYGNGQNIRDWLFVDDHIDALLLIAKRGVIGTSYCIGGGEECNNNTVVESICTKLDKKKPDRSPHRKLIERIKDRPGHDLRYSINYSHIKKELGWQPKYSFEDGLNLTINWYLENLDWCKHVLNKHQNN